MVGGVNNGSTADMRFQNMYANAAKNESAKAMRETDPSREMRLAVPVLFSVVDVPPEVPLPPVVSFVELPVACREQISTNI